MFATLSDSLNSRVPLNLYPGIGGYYVIGGNKMNSGNRGAARPPRSG